MRAMSTVPNPDPWTGKNWKLDTTSLSIEALMISDIEENNVFTLHPVRPGDQLLGYELRFAADKMAGCWNGLFLIPRGNQAVPNLLDPLEANPGDAKLQTAALATQAVVNAARFTTKRLECDIVLPAQVPILGSLSLYQIPRALGGERDFLVVSFRADGNPGGTGGGGSDHP
jgi:hypothetical protein